MQRMSRLDGLRGVLAVYVMLGHAMPFTCVPGWLAAPFRHGEAAVDLFFALSGLVVVHSLERFNHQFWPFMRGRARRLLPVYFTVLGLAVALVVAPFPAAAMGFVPAAVIGRFWTVGVPAHFFWHLAAHLVLLQGVIPQGALPYAYVTLLGPAWSLSTEWQFYVVMALVLARWRNYAGFALVLLAAGVLYQMMAPFLPPWWQFSRAFLPGAAPYFALGLASAVWLRGGGVWVLAVASVVCFGLGADSGDAFRACIPLGWLLALRCQAYPDKMPVLPGVLDSRAMQFLGVVSYPLYLLNEPVQRTAAMLIATLVHEDAGLFTVLWLPPAVLGPIAAAVVLHWGVEVPFASSRLSGENGNLLGWTPMKKIPGLRRRRRLRPE